MSLLAELRGDLADGDLEARWSSGECGEESFEARSGLLKVSLEDAMSALELLEVTTHTTLFN